MARKTDDPNGVWPFGRETEECGLCRGSGFSLARYAQWVESRALFADDSGEAAQRNNLFCCGHCEGRGQVITGSRVESARAG